MIIDAHIHCTGDEDADGVVQALDEAGIDVGVLLAPFLSPGYSLDDPASLRRGHAHLGRLVRAHPDRLVGLAVVDPRSPDAAQDLRRAREVEGLAGVKLVPTGWYPYDEAVQPVFATACELDMPVLCHSGIFIDGRSGRYCRPAFFEALRAHPGLRVTLAHLGWPWTDEAIAVGLIDLINGVPPDQVAFRFDISFGPPPPYRLEVLRRAIDVLGPGLLQFGSDCFLPCSGGHLAERRQWVVDLMSALQLDEPARERIWSGTAAAWLGRHCPTPRGPNGQPRTRATSSVRLTGWPEIDRLDDPDGPYLAPVGRPLRLVPRCC
ncbi:amidohydrolase family protein [Aquabacterium sp.]|uniref:amidohydrolase family protein n=1 Tax=Aquabacterium sp. TaxID=1872578 RepID=UPI0035C70470